MFGKLPSADAYVRSELSWTKVRLILPVLSPETERAWIAKAALLTTRELEEEIREAAEKADDESTGKIAAKEASATLQKVSAEDGKTIDGERAIRFRKRCSRRLRRIWKKVTELARRMAGEQLGPWQAAECVAAEGLSGAPVDRIEDAIERVEGRAAAQASAQTAHKVLSLRRATHPSSSADDPIVAGLARDVPGVNLSGFDDSLCNDAIRTAVNPTDLGPHGLDLQMRALVSALQRIDWTAGRLLRIAGDLRIYRQFGFSSLVEYAKDRLGISPRKVHALVSLDRKVSSFGELSSAYRDGRLSWSRVLAILPVIDRDGGNASVWVERARTVVIRRLRDEVDWAIDRVDLAGDGSSPMPPPLNARLETPEVQMRAPGDSTEPEGLDAEIAFTGPESVVSLCHMAVRAWTDRGETTERGMEKLLLHAYTEWKSQPRHRDPVFERDGWRCSAPICTSRKGFHDHHVLWRSRGGGNELWNRSSECVFHHDRIHDHGIRVAGRAPDELTWEIGCRPDGPPLMRLRGDVYLNDEGSTLGAVPVA